VSGTSMHYQRLAAALLIFVLPLYAYPPVSSNPPERDKTIWNYDGGILLHTDGALPEGPCFRLTGKVTDPEFFENLKREDTTSGTVYRRGHDVVSEFPKQLHLTFLMYDMPCDDHLQATGSHLYLNRALMSKLHVTFFWKRGMELRPAAGVALKNLEIHPLPHYADESVKDLPEKYEWWFDFDVPSASVPITDSLVVVILTSNHRIAARVAARL
jgi:hypothetical protein